MAKTWAPHYLLMQKEFENTCFIAVLLLWLFVHVKLKQSFVINLSSWISSLFVMKQGSRGNNLPITYPQIHSLVHGEQCGANFKPVQQCIRKLQLF